VLIEDEAELIQEEMRDVTPPKPAGNPYAAPALPDAQAPAEAPKAAKVSKPKAKEEAPATAPVEAAPAMPTRKQLYIAIRNAAEEHGIDTATAEAKVREVGLLTPDMESLANTTHEQLNHIAQNAGAIFAGNYKP
jgi:hypothetical protein